ncbi:ankyrin [Trematosphaeria pertusa]|uniref:Ankyrin n=1 Tax=Trematosphaeria pertusa TaxID=390896 RepID=A0A6A6IPT8_9PLEO|nr:ankyrin [Trematosphaeria pertusa]KAF2251513.1 ankyrin [Trematosphaeria pertusa]
MDGGASLVTFVVVALQSIKTVHGVISAVKDGPQSVRSLADSVAQLKSILERLSHIQLEPANSIDLTDLSNLTQRCATDLGNFESKLQGLNLSTDDRRFGRFWKRLKAAISEKELERMREMIRAHTLTLNFHLSLLQTAQLSFSSMQSTEILKLLKELKSDIAQSSFANHGTATSQNPNATATAIDATTTDTTESALEDSISRLIKLVNEKECTVESEDAEQLIDDLQTLIDSAHSKESIPVAPHEPGEGEAISNIARELKLATSLIFSAPSIAINSNARTGLIASAFSGCVIDQQRKRKVIDLDSGTLTVATNKRRRRHDGQQRDVTTDRSGASGREFFVEILFKPKTSQAMLAVSVSQGQLLRGSFSSIPRLSVNNVLPVGSLVFKLAENGRIEDLVSLVAAGKASLRDHDTEGQSLLHYAVAHPSMCKFLIQNGLDVDGIGKARWARFEATPLHECWRYDGHETAAILLEAGADPTITSGYGSSVVHLAAGRPGPTDEHILRGIFNLSAHFGVASFRDHNGRSPFLRACGRLLDWSTGLEQNIRKLSHLLERGCSIHDTDDDGSTCLHIIFSNGIDGALNGHWRDTLIYLIRQGADLYALDYSGASVSHIAYSETCYDRQLSAGTSRGDLFDFALDSCGYNILEFRKKYPRRGRYEGGYSRQDFELLWKGREERCPYWDDAEWPKSDKNSDGESRDSCQAFICVCSRRGETCIA